MAAEIKDFNDFKDKSGLLGKAKTTTNDLIKVFTVSEHSIYCQVNVNIVNISDTLDSTFKLWVSSAKVPTDIDFVESSVTLVPNAVYERHGFTLSSGESVFIQAGTDNLVVRIDGHDVRTK